MIPGIAFRHRSTEAEWMDDPSLDPRALELALEDIGVVNRLLGGNSVGLKGLKPFLGPGEGDPLEIVDIGCGNGEFLRFLARYCRRKKIRVRLTGIDRNAKSLAQGNAHAAAYPEIRYLCCDALEYEPGPGTARTVLICNLFLHHFSDRDIRFLLKRWKAAGVGAIVVNDLHRSPLAYVLFRIFGAIFMKSPVARHDGGVSIKRGFQRKELLAFSLGLPGWECRIRWKWAFRYLWTLTPPKDCI